MYLQKSRTHLNTSAGRDAKALGAIYASLGVKPIISGQGTSTTLGGSMIDPIAAQAMLDASRSMVLLEELNQKAGELIARYTRAEASLVTSGAAGGMLLQAAAVLAGSAPAKTRRLPNTDGMKNTILILDHHKEIGYLQAWRTAGARLLVVTIDGIETAEQAAEHVVGKADGSIRRPRSAMWYQDGCVQTLRGF